MLPHQEELLRDIQGLASYINSRPDAQGLVIDALGELIKVATKLRDGLETQRRNSRNR